MLRFCCGKGLFCLWTWPICLCGNFEEITMRSTYTMANCHLTVERKMSIVHWNAPGALRNPNGLRMNRYSLWCMVKVILSPSASSISICQYAIFASNAKRIAVLPRESIHSSMRGIWYESRFVTAFGLRQSTQTRNVPSFSAQRKLVQPIWSVQILWFSETASFQFWLFWILWFSVQHGIKPNVKVVYFCGVVWYGAVLCVFDRGDCLTSIENWSACLWARCGMGNIYERCALLLASLALRILSRHFLWRCGAIFAIPELL